MCTTNQQTDDTQLLECNDVNKRPQNIQLVIETSNIGSLSERAYLEIEEMSREICWVVMGIVISDITSKMMNE